MSSAGKPIALTAQNVLWVEQPVVRRSLPPKMLNEQGTGFSVGEVTATNETDIANDFADWFANWLDTLDALPGWSNVYAQNVTLSTSFPGYTFTLSAALYALST